MLLVTSIPQQLLAQVGVGNNDDVQQQWQDLMEEKYADEIKAHDNIFIDFLMDKVNQGCSGLAFKNIRRS